MVVVSGLSETSRGGDGFGSSGIAVRNLQRSSGTLPPEGDLLPVGEHRDGGVPGQEGVEEVNTGFVHAREHGRVVASGRVPDNLFFETFTSRGGETMQVFLERLKEGKLSAFS